MIHAISPVDGRYASKCRELQPFFSESALIKYRILVEVEYFVWLTKLAIIPSSDEVDLMKLRKVHSDFDDDEGQGVKKIELETNHDVKAVEYHIKNKSNEFLNSDQLEFIHFGLTSQDINNTALPLLINDALQQVILPRLDSLLESMEQLAAQTKKVAMLARTHGQPASPTTLGKEIYVFVERLNIQIAKLKSFRFNAKFGGATGNFNAHVVAYPEINWPKEMDAFIASLGLVRHQTTTQIAHYDDLAEYMQVLSRINTILIDFSRDIWTYISLSYFGQKVVEGEVGSSAMPHKVNPIDFENAEGNLGMANAIFDFLSGKLPISRLQRDLTDSTVTRNVGVPHAHLLIAIKSLLKGIGKLEVNTAVMEDDLTQSWSVIAEGIQTILRREGFKKPYELLRDFSRGKPEMGKNDYDMFIDSLPVSAEVKQELLELSPHNYLGYSNQ